MKTSIIKLVLCGVAASAVISGTAQATSPGRSDFEILMNGKPIGRHSVTVTRAGPLTNVRVAIDMTGKIGPIGFSYTHRCEEVWRENRLSSINCTDRENRRLKTLAGNSQGNSFAVDGSAFKGNVAADILPSSWWRTSTLRQTRILDSRDGKVSNITVTRVGDDTVKFGEVAVRATHYRVRGAVNTDLWYDASGRWVRTAFRIAGQSFDYRSLTPISSLPRE